MKQDTEARIAKFVERYDAGIAAQFKASRKRLRALVPRGYELVYDNYNAFAIGYSPSDKAPGAFISIVAYPRWVTLFFLYGKHLDDPDKLLAGSGSRVRSIRLESAATLDRPNVCALISQTLMERASVLGAAPRLTTIIKSISAKQRPRRATAAKKKRTRA
jgi:hypothetical protein